MTNAGKRQLTFPSDVRVMSVKQNPKAVAARKELEATLARKLNTRCSKPDWNNSVSMPRLHTRADRVTHVHSAYQSIKPIHNYRAQTLPRDERVYIPKPTKKWQIDPRSYLTEKEKQKVVDKPQYLSDRIEWESTGKSWDATPQIDRKLIRDNSASFLDRARSSSERRSASLSRRQGVRTEKYEPPAHRVHREMLESRMRRMRSEMGDQDRDDDETEEVPLEAKMRRSTTPILYKPGLHAHPDTYLPWRHSDVMEEYERVVSVMATSRPQSTISTKMPGLRSTSMLPTLGNTPGAQLVHVTKLGAVDRDQLADVGHKTVKKKRVVLSEKEKDDLLNCTFKPRLETPVKWQVDVDRYHTGVYGMVATEGRDAWSCCLAYGQDAQGCCVKKRVRNKHNRAGFCI